MPLERVGLVSQHESPVFEPRQTRSDEDREGLLGALAHCYALRAVNGFFLGQGGVLFGRDLEVLLVAHPTFIAVVVKPDAAPGSAALQNFEYLSEECLGGHLRCIGRFAAHRHDGKRANGVSHLFFGMAGLPAAARRSGNCVLTVKIHSFFLYGTVRAAAGSCSPDVRPGGRTSGCRTDG